MSFLRIAAIGLLGFILRTSAWAVPPHPTVLLVEEESSRLPVIKVIGTDPVVQSKSKEKRIRLQPTYYAERCPQFGNGRITFASISLSGFAVKSVMRNEDEPSPTGPLVGGGYDFEARLTSTVELKGGFIAVVIFDRDFISGGTPLPSAEILVHSLPDLPADRESSVKFHSQISQRQGTSSYFPLIFAAGGAEIRSSISDHSARYFNRVEQALLFTVLARYRLQFPSADRPAAPFLTIHPLLPDGIAPPTEAVVALTTVDANGHVSDVFLPPSLDSGLSAALRDTLHGWLFLPCLKSGQPVSSRVQIPFRF